MTGEAGQPRRRGIEEILAAARTRLTRLSPSLAYQAAREGALLVDIRPQAQRAAEGEIPGALIVERNVLEWRFDPASEARIPQASYDAAVIIVCSEGYTSSLAAASLQDLGVRNATDLDGGFLAWAAAGLPVQHRDPRGLRPVHSGALENDEQIHEALAIVGCQASSAPSRESAGW